MSIDRSLRARSSLTRHRNILTRAERIQRLMEKGDWDKSEGALALPKIPHRKAKAGKKKAKTTSTSTSEEAK